MTPFEIIILIIIYFFFVGYANSLLKADDESRWDIAIRIVASFIAAFYIPIFIGLHIANKLNN